eukprot:7886245-Ditylum_brightwellii.AAC.1
MPSHGLCRFYIGLVLFAWADKWGRQGTDLLSIHEPSEGPEHAPEHAPEHGGNDEIVNENDNDDVVIVELSLTDVSITSSSDANRS